MAKKYGKRKWEYGLLGAGVFLLSTIFIGTVGGLVDYFFNLPETDLEANLLGITPLNVIGWIGALVVVVWVKNVLEKKLEKDKVTTPSIDIELIGSKEID
ncbi:hypothetical protein [Elizabethkingia sp. JS20170427COW]|uniref:hypothetical protein n=1 Tax=Elizabethkingia sp. JS20170427COW TaxID=2583851 RepID=UPI00111013A1|nr:hypothetical protein [Elizabethkingia sp. JS20170427COW]QCX52720.1 hypothetical protein FGE20_02645 [Elizabethkingia sp. JS20170427COW]